MDGTCGSAEANPASANITVNGSGLSADRLSWICKVHNADLFNSHPLAYGALCSYPVNAPLSERKPKMRVEISPNQDLKLLDGTPGFAMRGRQICAAEWMGTSI